VICILIFVLFQQVLISLQNIACWWTQQGGKSGGGHHAARG
jgi:hypothetical protein